MSTIAPTPASDGNPANGADKSAFVGRLHLIMTRWPSADHLARAVGVSPSAFRKWLKGEAEPSRERLVALARAAGVGIAWLADGEGPPPAFPSGDGPRRRGDNADPPDGQGADGFVILPEQPLPVPPGATPMRHFLGLRPDWLRTACGIDPANAALITAGEDTMAPTIAPFDLLLIDTGAQSVDADAIYVLELAGRRQIRRVQRRHDGSLLLLCDNPAYRPDCVAAAAVQEIRVHGRVVWISRRV